MCESCELPVKLSAIEADGAGRLHPADDDHWQRTIWGFEKRNQIRDIRRADQIP